MKSKTTKRISAVLAVIMVFGSVAVMSGCKNKSASGSRTNPTGSTVTDTVPAALADSNLDKLITANTWVTEKDKEYTLTFTFKDDGTYKEVYQKVDSKDKKELSGKWEIKKTELELTMKKGLEKDKVVDTDRKVTFLYSTDINQHNLEQRLKETAVDIINKNPSEKKEKADTVWCVSDTSFIVAGYHFKVQEK
ncbi:MAG: hypothetical protein UIH27_07890 [Ruminococcus sp.]|nr:hypothetical protein [Ruminococcus sp.]